MCYHIRPRTLLIYRYIVGNVALKMVDYCTAVDDTYDDLGNSSILIYDRQLQLVKNIIV